MLKKGFLRDKDSIQIGKKRVWLSVFVGLFSSFSVYAFFCLFRLTFRLLEFKIGNGPFILDPSIRFWQNFNFSIIALVLGNAIFLGSLFRRPNQARIPNYRRLTILNNQTAVGFNFFHLFAKMYFLAGLFYHMYMDVQEIKEPIYLFVLSGLVLFLESWKMLLRQFRKRAMKWMVINFLVLLALSFILPNTSVFDYKSIDQLLLASNPPIDLPESDFREDHVFPEMILKLRLDDDKGVVYDVNGNLLTFDELFPVMLNITNKPRYGNNRGVVYIAAPFDIKISEINRVQRLLTKLDRFNLVYVTVRPKLKFTSRFELKGIRKRISARDPLSFEKNQSSSTVPLPFPLNEDFEARTIELLIAKGPVISIRIDNGYFMDNVKVNEKQLDYEFKKRINSVTSFHIQYGPNISYQEYITLFANYKQAIFELRKEEELVHFTERELYNEENEYQYKQDQERLSQKYPMSYFENYRGL